ncbi:hypothetical protein [Streptomyces fuscigenes]|uniref:hypothetical protein n=1 Tax=Streptomyces fuscigenes TaxID=1528880 RepID=UPI001F229DB0|nr:hypothetical protein [Streptomyces fuscigenes]MCF3962778.1 hypothetical protein [Streptomyces fuscigenes]
MADHEAEPEPQPLDEDAAWAAIVAGYGEEPTDPPGAKPFKSVDDLASLDSKSGAAPQGGPDEEEPGTAAGTGAEGPGAGAGPGEVPPRALGGSVVFAPGVGIPVPTGPRDFRPADDPDEGHFVPPEPPPLPEADATAKFAWLGALGGPVLALVAVLLQWDMTWWLTTVCAGGFLGGIATLVARMKHDDEDDDGDPGRGAVV